MVTILRDPLTFVVAVFVAGCVAYCAFGQGDNGRDAYGNATGSAGGGVTIHGLGAGTNVPGFGRVNGGWTGGGLRDGHGAGPNAGDASGAHGTDMGVG